MKKIVSVILAAGILFSCKRKKTVNLVQVIVTDSIINTMQGGFGASMHAIDDSLPVSTDHGNYRSWGGRSGAEIRC